MWGTYGLQLILSQVLKILSVPAMFVVGYTNFWIWVKVWSLLYVSVGKTLHLCTIYKKRKSIVLQVFLHGDNPWIWSKLWIFFFVRIRPSKPRISEYLKILPNIIYKSILTNKTENKFSLFWPKSQVNLFCKTQCGALFIASKGFFYI